MNDLDNIFYAFDKNYSVTEKLQAFKETINAASTNEKSIIFLEYIQKIVDEQDFSIDDLFTVFNEYNDLNINDLDILDILDKWGKRHYAIKSVSEKIGLHLATRIKVNKEKSSPINEVQLKRWGILEGQDLIDEVLGKYDPDKQEIILYTENIKSTANHLNISENILTQLVEIHEAAHAIIHLGIDADGINFNTNSYKGIDRGKFPSPLHETLAQLLCYHCVKDGYLRGFIHYFENLNRCQPKEYRLWEQFKDVPLERIRSILIEIRQQRIGASFEAFKARALD
ncbi:hypothetical protein [Nostoc sp.]